MPNHDPGGEVILKSRKFTVKRRAVRGTDGNDHEHDFIVHPGAAVILPVMEDGRILLLRNERASVGQTLLELPAGTLEPAEDPRNSAIRELEEETGWKAAHMQPLASFYSSPGILTEMMHCFVATELSRGKEQREPTEKLELAPMTLDEALAAIRAGRIKDGKTLAALLYYNTFRRSRENR
jgi:ADP-ribose pyrophosphatase